MYTTFLFSIAALSATVLAAPAPAAAVTGTESALTATPLGGALNPTKAPVANPEALAAAPGLMTISVVNL